MSQLWMPSNLSRGNVSVIQNTKHKASTNSVTLRAQDIFFGSVKDVKKMKYTLQPPVPSDAEDIQALHSAILVIINPNRVYGVPLGWTQARINWWEEKGIEVRQKSIQDSYDHPKQVFWEIAKNQWGQIVGFSQAHKSDDSKEAQLDALFIHPDLQGSKIGFELLQNTCAWALKQGGEELKLSVAPYNPAISFYRNFGFDFVRDSFTIAENVLPLINMTLNLSTVQFPSTTEEAESNLLTRFKDVLGTWMTHIKSKLTQTNPIEEQID